MGLRFTGDLHLWQGALAAAAACVILWRLYRPELRGVGRRARARLPAVLRCAAVCLVILCLTGPVVTRRRLDGAPGRVVCVLDASRSMAMDDAGLDDGRAFLIAAARGRVAPAPEDAAGLAVARLLASARRELEELKGRRIVSVSIALSEGALTAIEDAAEALARIDPAAAAAAEDGLSGADARDALSARFRREVLEPAREAARGARLPRLEALCAAARAWERHMERVFAAWARGRLAAADALERAEVRQTQLMPRWDRAQEALLDARRGLLRLLAEAHEVEVIALRGEEAATLWHSRAGREVPRAFDAAADGAFTDLRTPLEAYMADARGERTAVVLLSDGGHNRGAPPAAAAAVLGARGIPVHTVGFGMHAAPADLAAQDVAAPRSVHAGDAVKGYVTVMDTMPAGTPFVLRIMSAGRELARKELVTQGAGARRVDFEVSLAGVIEAQAAARERDVEMLSMPVKLEAVIEAVPGETRTDNNTAATWLRTVTHGRRVLLLDGRPRWETRYIRNLFERDRQWEIDTLIAAPEGGWLYAEGAVRFPPDDAALFAYDLVILGEVPPGRLDAQALARLRRFVENRGGGLIVVDGPRGHLAALASTALGPVIPVAHGAAGAHGVAGAAGADWPVERLELTAAGSQAAELRLESDAARNDALWRQLPVPRHVAETRAREGSETFVEAVSEGRRRPLLVGRRFGAGYCLYLASDETWRWRYEAADRYHARFWNQAAHRVMETPYAVRDRYVSLDAGGPLYEEGVPARFRVRVRGRDGNPTDDARATVVITRSGVKAASLALSPDAGRGGVYRGTFLPPGAGEYEAAVRVDGFSDLEMLARTSFSVAPREAPELKTLTCDEELLGAIASASGGRYVREEDASALAELLAPLSEGRIVVRETHLGQSWWWFAPIIVLLALEWMARKRAGLI